MFGKYPPIEGGTASQTYLTTRLIAEAGHGVDVVTNAEQAEPSVRALMTDSDRVRLSEPPASPTGGWVKVHHTTALEDSSYVPWAKPFASQLFGLGSQLTETNDYDAVLGWYWEPYALVAAQVATAAGIPLIVRHAGSDVGRLARQPELRSAYRWLTKQADRILTGPGSAKLLERLGADPTILRMVERGRIPEYFASSNAMTDFEELAALGADRYRSMGLSPSTRRVLVDNLARSGDLLGAPTIGIYGKVAESKGSYDLLSALDQVGETRKITLLGAIGGPDGLHRSYLNQVARTDRIGQRAVLFPFIAPWRVPGFLDACSMVCVLERRFDVPLHRSRVPQEVMSRGRPLVLSGEIADKVPFRARLVPGQNYIRVDDPTDRHALADTLRSWLSDPAALHEVGSRGRSLIEELGEWRRPDGPTVAITTALAELVGG